MAELEAEHRRLLGYLDLSNTMRRREVVSPGELEAEIVSMNIQDGMSIPAAFAENEKWRGGGSDLDSFSFESLLRHHQEQVERAIRGLGLDELLQVPVFVGGYPLGHPTADVKRIGEGYLILMDYALMMGLHRAAKVFVWSNQFLSNSASPLEGAAVVWSRRRAVQTLGRMCSCYFSGDLNAAPRDPVPPGIRMWLMVAMVGSSERLVLAHEYAHIQNGDVDEPPLCKDADDETEKHYIERRRAAEMNADLTAFSIGLAKQDWSGRDEYGRNEVRAILAGGALLFGLTNLLRLVGREVYGDSRFDDEYHPEPFERAAAVRASLVRRLDGELLGFWDWCVDWWRTCAGEVVEASRSMHIEAIAREQRLSEALHLAPNGIIGPSRNE